MQLNIKFNGQIVFSIWNPFADATKTNKIQLPTDSDLRKQITDLIYHLSHFQICCSDEFSVAAYVNAYKFRLMERAFLMFSFFTLSLV